MPAGTAPTVQRGHRPTTIALRLSTARQQAARLAGLPAQLRAARTTYESAAADLDRRLAARAIGRDWYDRQLQQAQASLAGAVETARSVQAEALTAVRANLDGLAPEDVSARPSPTDGLRLPATMRISRGYATGAAGSAGSAIEAQAAGLRARAGAYGRLVDVLAEGVRQLALGSPVDSPRHRLGEAYAEADAVRAVAEAEAGQAVA